MQKDGKRYTRTLRDQVTKEGVEARVCNIPVTIIAKKYGIPSETVRRWVRMQGAKIIERKELVSKIPVNAHIDIKRLIWQYGADVFLNGYMRGEITVDNPQKKGLRENRLIPYNLGKKTPEEIQRYASLVSKMFEGEEGFFDITELEDVIRERFSKKEIKILNEYYGLNGKENRVMREVASSNNMSTGNVGRIVKKATEDLMRAFGKKIRSIDKIQRQIEIAYAVIGIEKNEEGAYVKTRVTEEEVTRKNEGVARQREELRRESIRRAIRY
ncbi:MAG: hypothetical protein FWC68_02510 [Oscillospiraceae bacterium]|nr:hypothetical protein [Oscillospiraceae bacterium]